MAHQLPADRRHSLLQKLADFCGRHARLVLCLWVIAVLGLSATARVVGSNFSDNVRLHGTQASTGLDILKEHGRGGSGYVGTIVIHGQQSVTAYASQINQLTGKVAALSHVQSVTNPFASKPYLISADQRTTYLSVAMDVNPKTLDSSYVQQLDTATANLRSLGLEVEYGGSFDELTRPKTKDGASELIGFGVALVVLLIGFRSVIAAGLPLILAFVSVLAGLGLLELASHVLTFGTAAPTLALMIGLGVGIDYSLFILTRFRQQLIEGKPTQQAVVHAIDTSGRAVLVAAATVGVALLGLYVSGISFIGQLGFAALFGVVTAALGAVSLVPASLSLIGKRIDRYRIGTAVAEAGNDHDWWHRYAAMVGKRPVLFLLVGLVFLGILAAPLLSIRLGHVDDGADPTSYTDKRAYDLIANGFGAGANGPFTIVIDRSQATKTNAEISQAVTAAVHQTDGVAHLSTFSPTSDGALLVATVIPTEGPQAAATTTLFNKLVNTVLPDSLQGSKATGYVTGSTASYLQFSDSLTRKLPVIIVVVVATAFFLIITAFRGLWLAVKAALVNLISISAAYGIVVAVFQWGWGRNFLGISENVPIESYVPVLMFAIVFGLSMDYEVFLLSHVKESWDKTQDSARAVAAGLSNTGRVITCAALIMASVFTAFVASPLPVVKMLAIGLSASVLIDATIVRLLLVPAIMYLLGKHSWWLPRWLDRLLPQISIE